MNPPHHPSSFLLTHSHTHIHTYTHVHRHTNTALNYFPWSLSLFGLFRGRRRRRIIVSLPLTSARGVTEVWMQTVDYISLKASERISWRCIQWSTCVAGGKGKSCSQCCKSFKVSTALCGFQHSSLLTYSLNHLPLFPLFLALFINSCTVNSPWPSSSHFSLSLSLSLASVLLRGCSDRESREDLSKGCCCQVNGKSFTCLFEALLKCALSFITNWPYGLLSFMVGLQRETPSDPLTFCKLNKKNLPPLQLPDISEPKTILSYFQSHRCDQDGCFQTSEEKISLCIRHGLICFHSCVWESLKSH